MGQSAITIVINNNTYSLSANNPEAMRIIPDTDRQQLIALLEVMKKQERAVPPVATPAVTEAASTVSSPADYSTSNPERLSSGDVDSLMARLIMEERMNQKPGLTKETLYKWIAGVAIVIILLVAIM